MRIKQQGASIWDFLGVLFLLILAFGAGHRSASKDTTVSIEKACITDRTNTDLKFRGKLYDCVYHRDMTPEEIAADKENK